MAGGHGSRGGVDVVRKATIVGILLAALVLLHRFAVPSDAFDPRGLLALGFVVLASFAIGELAEAIGLPHITGYLLAGIALGPSAAQMLADGGVWLPPPFDHGILSYEVIGQLGLLDQLALALIALTAGGDLLIEQLKKAAREIVAMVAAQMAVVFVAVLAFVYVISLGIPGFSLDVLVGRPTIEVLALAAVVACIAMATSPAATIAVINGLGAKGPVTMRVLPGVVLSEVLVTVAFSAVLGFALSATGGEGGGGVYESLMHLLVSVLLGLAVGFVTYAYLRWVGVELVLFLVGLVFSTTWLAHVLGGEPALVFVAAGFSIANFSDQGERLIHEVERLSMPVYVVFFTLAGAKLHLDILLSMLAVAVGLWLVRAAAVTGGVKLGARLAGSSDVVRRHAYAGFLSQAGMAISLSAPIAVRFPGGLGDGLYALILAVIALNEMTGPVMLQRGLTAAGEAHKRNAGEGIVGEDGAPAPVADDEPLPALSQLAPAGWEDAGEEAWGEPLRSASPALDALVAELELDLHSLVRDVSTGPFTEAQEETRAYLRALRREFLRQHRRAMVRAQSETDPRVLSKFLVAEVSELAERWRDLALDRAARVARDRWTPMPLVDALDAQVASLTELERVPLEPTSLRTRAEPLLLRIRRSALVARHRVAPVVREVPVRDLARYHLSGVAVGRLEALCTLMVNADIRLAERTRGLFDAVATSYRHAAARAEEGCDATEMHELIARIRDEVEADFAVALDEFDTLPAEAASRAARVLGSGLRAFKADLLIVGTLDLPSWHRRYSRVFGERNAGLDAFDGGMLRARETVAARFSALALALEVVGLEGRMREAVEEHSATLGRQIKGRAITQVARVITAYNEALTVAEAALGAGEPGVAVSAALRGALEPAVRLSNDARDTVAQLRDWLANEVSDAPLLEDLLAAAQVLTERYEVPVGRPSLGAWKLPTPVPLAEVPFREVAVTFIESALSRDLIDVTRRLAVKIDTLVATLEELERVCTFNLGLATAEIDVHRTELVSDETQDVVREMVGAVHRSVQRLERLAEEAQPWPEQARQDVRAAVLRELDQFRARVFDGEVHDLRGMLMREAAGRRFMQAAGAWTGGAREAWDRWLGHARRLLGDDRLLGLAQFLGVPDAHQHLVHGERFALPVSAVELPVVYRRLFSDQALEAGDLLTGRQAEVTRARAVLTRRTPGALRTVAIVGLAGIGKGALVNAVLRGLEDVTVRRVDLRAPPTAEQVESWFAHEGTLIVLTGFDHMFQMRGGGFALLERWVRLVVRHSGSVSWLVSAESAVWRFGSSVAPLEEAFGEVLRLEPLDAEGLERALLARHTMSGYALRFRQGEDLWLRLQRLAVRNGDVDARRQAAWFRQLHQASGGVIHDALRLWLASIEQVDEAESEVVVGSVPRPPRDYLLDLSADTWLTLRQVMQQGWTTPALHAGVFDLDEGRSEATLAALADLGLLIEDQGAYFVTEHLRAPVCQVLIERGWL